jgi:hypothetical protein
VTLRVTHGHLGIEMIIHGDAESARWIRSFSISVRSGRGDRLLAVLS